MMSYSTDKLKKKKTKKKKKKKKTINFIRVMPLSNFGILYEQAYNWEHSVLVAELIYY